MQDPSGDFHVTGIATDGSVDHDMQIAAPAWASKAIKKWLSTGGNVRVSHNPGLYPAGKGVEAWTDGNGATWVKSLIVEPTAQMLVQKGVLRAYSVGIARPAIERDLTGKARGGIITDGEIVELSLVDRPANPNCGIRICKSVSGEYVCKAFGKTGRLLTKAEKKTAKQIRKDMRRPAGDPVYAELYKTLRTSDNPSDRETARELLLMRGALLCHAVTARHATNGSLSRKRSSRRRTTTARRGYTPWKEASR